jgi:hypothetical protein
MISRDKLEDIVRKNLDVRASDGTYDRMRDIVLSAHGPARTTESAPAPVFKGRTIMRNPIARLAVAAAVLIALGLGASIFLGTGSPSGVVWAQVADRVDASGGLVYRTRNIYRYADRDQPHEFSTMTYQSPRYGMRMEGIEGSRIDSYVSFEEGTQVTLFRDMKRYTQRTLPSRLAGAGADMPAGATARDMVRQFTAGDYKELGRRTIDGVPAEGIETQHVPGGGGNFQVDSETAQLWVSVETGYPVLLEIHVVGNNDTLQVEMIMDQFQWDVELDPAQFKTVIPPDYQPLEIRMGEGGAMVGRAVMEGGSDDSQ